MNNKMTTKSQLSTTEPKKEKAKNKLGKQLEQEQNHRNGDQMEGYQWGGEERGKNGGKGTGNKKHKLALANVAQWIECWPANQGFSHWIPCQSTCLGCKPGPVEGK